jgi:YidC/Oxa1 family membrane protein insertase
MYGRIKRTPETETSSGFMGSMKTYTGAAVTTPSSKYKKISFDDMKKASFKESILGGWAAMVEHYFTVAWIPPAAASNFYQSEVISDNLFSISYVGEPITVEPGESKELSSTFYAGPEITEMLKQVSPGLELTVDYGFFWVISYPLFIALKYIYGIVGNWGLAIICITFGIKLLFYPLSSASYRSMGNMRKLQPKIEALKQQYGEDKQQFGQAVMQLYKREKVNPLGGCLPILVQIPVFISLYYVLLESVELRLAPFIFWIHDLSAKDPYYVLPLIMGASMVLQQRMNPAPPDPMQAKVMMFMPVFFTFLFLQFPSGLVLYWVVNNVLSIIQQWYITRKIVR